MKVAVSDNGTAPESLTVTVYVVDVLGTVGVPVIAPMEEKDKPEGNDGETLNVHVPVPPVAVIGVNVVATIPCCKVLVGTTVLMTIGIESTDKENVSDLD